MSAPAPVSRAARPIPPRPAHVLIVKQDRAVRTALTAALERHGYVVRAVSDPSAMDAVAASFQPDLVVLDPLLARAGVRAGSVWEIAGLVVDETGHVAERGGHRIDLTPTEFSLLAALCRHSGQVLSKHRLLADVWGGNRHVPNVVEARMSGLRRKLEAHGPRIIHTVRGVGYVLRA